MIFITPALPVVESKGNGFSLEILAVIGTVSRHVTLSTFGSKLLNCCYFTPGLQQKWSQQVQNSNFFSPTWCTLRASVIQQCYTIQALLMRRLQCIIRPFHKQYSIAKKSPICCPTPTFLQYERQPLLVENVWLHVGAPDMPDDDPDPPHLQLSILQVLEGWCFSQTV